MKNVKNNKIRLTAGCMKLQIQTQFSTPESSVFHNFLEKPPHELQKLINLEKLAGIHNYFI